MLASFFSHNDKLVDFSLIFLFERSRLNIIVSNCDKYLLDDWKQNKMILCECLLNTRAKFVFEVRVVCHLDILWWIAIAMETSMFDMKMGRSQMSYFI